MKTLMKFTAAVAVAAASGLAQAADYNPIGVQNDVAWDDVVTNGGWSSVYSGRYSDTLVRLSDIFDLIPQYSQVMLAARYGETSGDKFDVLAWATKEDILTQTAWNQTHAANGAQWYYNGYSMGFAGLTDAIYQATGDIQDTYILQSSTLERDRLSWQTSLGRYQDGYYIMSDTGSPIYLEDGYRSGENVDLASSPDWMRYVLYRPGVAPAVPEPETYGMMMAGLGLIGYMARRRKQQA